jgi:uncharacterized membrane protein (UPF0127 family)
VASFVTETQTAAAAPRSRRAKTVVLVNRNGAVVCERCAVADTMLARMRGLLGRKHLPRGEGILLRPCPSVQTFFMRFPVDVVFLSRDGEVLKIVENLRPWRSAGARRAHATLELAAGEAARVGIAVGDRLVTESPPERES